MLEFVNEDEKERCYEILKREIEKMSEDGLCVKNPQILASRGGETETNVYWFDSNNWNFEEPMCVAFNVVDYKMGIGLDFYEYIPKKTVRLPITVWITICKRDKEKLCAGRFAKYSKIPIEERFVVLHTGKIGGGRKGVGKNCFWANYSGKKVYVGSERFAFVCEYNKSDPKAMIQQMYDFAMEVRRIVEICRKS